MKQSVSVVKYKMIKIGHIFASVAICALGFSGAASAATVILGSTISGSSSSGSTIYNGSVQSYNYGVLLGSQATTINNAQYQSTSFLTGSIRQSSTTTNVFGALGVSNGIGASADNFVLGTAATVNSVTLGTAASGQYSPTTYYYSEVMNTYVRDREDLTGLYSSSEYLDNILSSPVGFSTGTALGTSNVYISSPSTYSCNIALSSYTCYNAATTSLYTNLTPTFDQNVGGGGAFADAFTVGKAQYTDTYLTTDWTGSIGTASIASSYAVNTSGSLTLNGGNDINGSVIAGGGVYVAGSGNYLNGDVQSNISFTDAGSVTIAGGGDLTGNVNFNGQNGVFTLSDGSNVSGSIDTSGARTGTLVFENNSVVGGSIGATAAIKEIQLNGVGDVVVLGSSKANTVNLYAAGTAGFNGGLDTRLADNTLGTVSFNNYDGTVQIGNNANLVGNVINSADGLGTLTFVSGDQSMTGQIGTSTNKIKTLNIGGTGVEGGIDTSSTAYSNTTINGDIFADQTVFNSNGTTNNSELILASGYNLTGNSVTTTDANMGILTLAGGNQIVTATVGTDSFRLNTVNSGATGANSTITGDVFAVNVTNTGTGTSNFNGNVTATNVNVDSGTTNVAGNVDAVNVNIGSGTANVDGNVSSTNITILSGTGNFNQSVTATTTSIGAGTANFNILGGTSSSSLLFTGNGTANLNQGLSFSTVNFDGNDGVVNVMSGKDLLGTTINTTANGTGYLNLQGGTQTVNAAIGASGLGLNTITAGADGATTNFTNTASVFANTLDVTGNGTVNLAGGLTGNLTYSNNVAGENGTVVIASGKDLTGNVFAGVISGSSTNQGILTLSGGNQTVSGTIGSSTAALTTINAGATSGVTTLNGMAYANTLQFTGNGTVVLNGVNGDNNAASGFQGTVDFGTNINSTGQLQIGDGVNLTTGSGGIQFADANAASLRFNGNSTVAGVLGGDTSTNSTFAQIYAGRTSGATVTFQNHVYVMENSTSPSTLYAGPGTVNLQGNLYGDLVFDGDGTVNVSDGKSLIVTTAPLAASTIAGANTGTLNFLGGTTLGTDLGARGANFTLRAINFHSDSTVVDVSQDLGYNLYATDVTIGNGVNTTTANILNNIYLGNNVTLTPTTTVNTAGDMSVVNGSVAIGANDQGFTSNANGTLSTLANVTQSTFGSGALTTNDATLNFALGTSMGGLVSTGNSSSISGTTLNMNGDEQVNIAYLGSLRNNQTYSLITAVNGSGSVANVTVTDNSYVIDSTLSRSGTDGSLLVTTSRDANSYIDKSGMGGDYSSAAAVTLGTLAAAGTGYSADMQTVLNKLDVNQWGYGNNQANLATQVRRLAPIANLMSSQTALYLSSMTTGVVGSRMANLRGDTLVSASDLNTGLSAGDAPSKDGVWLKVMGAKVNQGQSGQYDGYNSNAAGVALGFDHKLDQDLLLGVALSTSGANADETGAGTGNNLRVNSYQLTGYGSYNINQNLYVDGALSYATSNYSGNRMTVADRNASSSFNGNQGGAKIGVGYSFDLGNKLVLTPQASLDYSMLKQNAYTETGAGDIGLNVDSTSYNRLRAGVGALMTKEYENGGMIYRPEIALNYYHDSGSALNSPISASFIGGGGTFVTPSSTVDSNLYSAGIGLAILNGKSTSVKIRYDYMGGQSYTSNAATLTGRYVF